MAVADMNPKTPWQPVFRFGGGVQVICIGYNQINENRVREVQDFRARIDRKAIDF